MTATTTKTEMVLKLESLRDDVAAQEGVANEAVRLLQHIEVITETNLTDEQKDVKADLVFDKANATIKVNQLNRAGDHLLNQWTELTP